MLVPSQSHKRQRHGNTDVKSPHAKSHCGKMRGRGRGSEAQRGGMKGGRGRPLVGRFVSKKAGGWNGDKKLSGWRASRGRIGRSFQKRTK